MPHIRCPHCAAAIKAPDAAVGKTVHCPQCSRPFAVPGMAAPAAPAVAAPVAVEPHAVLPASSSDRKLFGIAMPAFLLVAGVALGAGLLLGGCGGFLAGRFARHFAKPPVIEPDKIVDAGNGQYRQYWRVAQKYSNLAAAEQKYQNRRIRFEGNLVSVQRQSGGWRLLLDPGIQVNTDIQEVAICDFPASAGPKLAELHPGAWLTLIGTCRGMIDARTIYFEDCSVDPSSATQRGPVMINPGFPR